MCNKRAIISAIEPLPPGDWLSSTMKIFGSSGYHTYKSKATLWVWKDIKARDDNTIFSDGAIIRRLWLSESRWALSVISKRIYFKEDRVSIDKRPEYAIAIGNRPNLLQPNEQIKILWDIMGTIKVSMKQSQPKPVDVEEVIPENMDTMKIYIKNSVRVAPNSSYNSIYKEFGFDLVPSGMEIYLCPIGSATSRILTEFENNLSKCLKERHVSCCIKTLQLSALKRNIDLLIQEKRKPNKSKCILFLMPSKRLPPESDTLKLFDDLERLSVPFRRAYQDDPFMYSVPNQLPSIVSAAGGRAHRSPFHINDQPIWTVGLDMGHSANRNYTKLALTLIDPDGALAKAWVALQKLDETIDSEAFRDILRLCAMELKSYAGNPLVVFLRDGRFFERDEINYSKEVFGKNLSIFEYRKNLNPQLYYFEDSKPTILEKPFSAIVPNSNTIFISILESQDKKPLHKTAKVTWKNEWNGLKLTPSQIAGLLMQSATAPGLGLQPRLLPASIYWADGIASTSETDLRFRGQLIHKLY